MIAADPLEPQARKVEVAGGGGGGGSSRDRNVHRPLVKNHFKNKAWWHHHKAPRKVRCCQLPGGYDCSA